MKTVRLEERFNQFFVESFFECNNNIYFQVCFKILKNNNLPLSCAEERSDTKCLESVFHSLSVSNIFLKLFFGVQLIPIDGPLVCTATEILNIN